MLLKYMYASDDQIMDVGNKVQDNASNVRYNDLHKRFQSANCLNLNNCISYYAENNTLVINKYLKRENYPSTKE